MDIALQYDNASGTGQWALINGDLALGNDLESAVMVSLFTDCLATSDFTPTDRTDNRRGFWGDSFEATPTGSNLWQFDRAKFTDNTKILLRARDYTKQALQWLIDDGVAASISVVTAKLGISGLQINIVITKPVTNIKVPFQYSVYWGQEGL